ncbi:hypothetical protein FRB95_011463 [Tulasnella sp. JGI-2019a]|nr:hypothetical protein FRB95_011463 [Tulasnella sp. JGI-2019a]
MTMKHNSCRVYGDGKSEPFLAALNLKANTTVDTKVSPWNNPGAHRPENLRKLTEESLSHFRPHGIKIRVFYLHAPDLTVPYEETVAEVDRLHKEGAFEEFGLSNYPAWEVAQIWTICKERGYILPTVYQGIPTASPPSMEPVF